MGRENDIMSVYVLLGVAVLLGLLLALGLQLVVVSSRVSDLEELISEEDDEKSPLPTTVQTLVPKPAGAKLLPIKGPTSVASASSVTLSSQDSRKIDAVDLAERGGLQVLTDDELSQRPWDVHQWDDVYLRRVKSDSAWLDEHFKPSFGVRRRLKAI